jgi:uncharacterized protein YqeY
MTKDAATSVRERLRDRLMTAMRSRDPVATSVYRSLIAAIDNAQAVPLEVPRRMDRLLAFGDRSAERSRRSLRPSELEALITAEASERRAAAQQLMDVGQAERAGRLRAEAALIEAFLGEAGL